MKSDGLVPIESLVPGDLVLARDDQTGALAYQPIDHVIITADKQASDLRLDRNGVDETIGVTSEHPRLDEDHTSWPGKMPLRSEVQQLVLLGPFPPESTHADEHDIARRQHLLERINPPLTREEAAALLSCFGPDDAFGLAWALLHLIEATPGGIPISAKPQPSDNEWVQLLWERSHR